MMELDFFFDTETTGFPSKAPLDDPSQPTTVQLGMILSTREKIYAECNFLILPDWEFSIHPKAQEVHGISKEDILRAGMAGKLVSSLFMQHLTAADKVICHNYAFDSKLISIHLHRTLGQEAVDFFNSIESNCTMDKSTDVCKLPGRYGKYKWPKLQELHQFLFNEGFEGAHDALEDVRATRRCYYRMQELGLI